MKKIMHVMAAVCLVGMSCDPVYAGSPAFPEPVPAISKDATAHSGKVTGTAMAGYAGKPGGENTDTAPDGGESLMEGMLSRLCMIVATCMLCLILGWFYHTNPAGHGTDSGKTDLALACLLVPIIPVYKIGVQPKPEKKEDTAEDLSMADRLERLAAVIIDGVIIILASLPFATAIGNKVFYFAACPLSILALNFFMLLRRGQTIGKLAMRIRIADYGGDVPGFKQMILRLIVLPLMFIPLIGYVIILVDVLFIFGEDRYCLHDHIAETQVLKAGYPRADAK